MADFVESAKHLVSAAVSRTTWEAQKQLRIRNKQGEIDQLLKQRQLLLEELATAAMTLYQQGALSQPQLARICASIQELDADLSNREQQLQEIKNETYQPEQFAPQPPRDYTPPPVTPTAPTTQQAPTVGGAPGMTRASAGAGGSGTSRAADKVPCPHCGQPVRVRALYCSNCGKKIG
ncbi:zinc ribbon domain-containing protein [Thermogemmatispora onikobensis]|uniref:zinc ribbon domain-containing protein n=1 Tax=Thermogemmatispora onikobensis TaxID=732234 RepID=UPI000852EC8A|nr:zinc ribbon domain-containing protein [Thermogemmatispora onikobensis]